MKVKQRLIGIGIWCIAFFGCSYGQNFTRFVNPFIGTGGHGHTFPGATLPFGMVQLSPDTRLEGWDGCSGYHYTDTLLYGFSHTHLSGTGIPDYGDVLIMPTVGKLHWNNGYKGGVEHGYASRFSHTREYASPGFYKVYLSDYDILAELTVTPRVGFHKYTFPKADSAHIILDLLHRDALLDSDIEILTDSTFRGKRISKSWANHQYIYFYGVFSRPFKHPQLHTSSIANPPNTVKNTQAAFTFHTQNGEIIYLKIGISAVSWQGAQKNLEKELSHWDFEQTRRQAEKTWNKELSKIRIESKDPDKSTIFYTALYHTMIHPNLFMDVDSQYRGTDLKIHPAHHFTNYTVFSLWDTYRAAHPLYTLIQRGKTRDFIHTFLHQYRNGGQLPVWELAGNYTGCMIGYHSVSVITDAYVKGIRDFDVNLALQAMRHSAMMDHLGLKYYRNHGVISAGTEPESVSKTLEYAYDDACIAWFARAIGHHSESDYFIQRAQYYKNVFDPSSAFMRARMNQQWFAPFDPSEVNYNYTEANSWQYSFAAPQDIVGLTSIYGGKKGLEQKLDQLFQAISNLSGRVQPDITGLIGQYAHGNEPSHHIAYLYNYTDRPDKTQALIHRIMKEMYHNTPDGLAGNEDCGQMSAWYVFSALGFYPVTPGLPLYSIGTPAFSSADIQLENGHVFHIKAHNLSDTQYFIKEVFLDGKPLASGLLKHEDIISGDTLEFVMGSSPGMKWSPNDLIPSLDSPLITPIPYMVARSKTFTDSLWVTLADLDPNCKIYYCLNDTNLHPEYRIYKTPILLKSSTLIRALAEKSGTKSFPIEAHFYKVESNLSLTLKTPYANQYAGGGDNALIDQLRGGENYRTGAWQGFQGQDLEAVIDLGKSKFIHRVDVGFLQDIKSWIWYPKSLVIEVGNTLDKLTEIAKINSSFPIDRYGAFTCELGSKVGVSARYIRIKAINRGPCPPWHLGAGGKSWIFADEIVIDHEE